MLNARRHRRGNQCTELAIELRSDECSTPEGIGGGIRRIALDIVATDTVLNARRHRRGNQRRGRSSYRRAPRVLNARRHRRGNQRSRHHQPRDAGGVLNARRHRRGNQPTYELGRMRLLPVLNARRHRRGNQRENKAGERMWTRCSTPEGIGGGIRSFMRYETRDGKVCSTPEGIGGGISALLERTKDSNWRCSTPEGIGGGISSCPEGSACSVRSAQRPKASEGESEPPAFCIVFSTGRAAAIMHGGLPARADPRLLRRPRSSRRRIPFMDLFCSQRSSFPSVAEEPIGVLVSAQAGA